MLVYHFLNEEHALDDLRRRRLKVATINELNDPFELLGPASTNKNQRAMFEMVKNMAAAYFGLICFSRNWSSPVQWSHYADGHRGLCLGFDVPRSCLHSVSYSKKRLEIDFSTFDGPMSASLSKFKEILTTKYDHWSYEDEERYFVGLNDLRHEAGLYFLPFANNFVLRKVIVGHRCPLTKFELRKHLSMATNVALSKARLAFTSFDVVRQMNPKLWV